MTSDEWNYQMEQNFVSMMFYNLVDPEKICLALKMSIKMDYIEIKQESNVKYFVLIFSG